MHTFSIQQVPFSFHAQLSRNCPCHTGTCLMRPAHGWPLVTSNHGPTRNVRCQNLWLSFMGNLKGARHNKQPHLPGKKHTAYLEDHPRTCKWLGTPPFVSHGVWPFGRGPTTRSLGGLHINHGLINHWNKFQDDPPTKISRNHGLIVPWSRPNFLGRVFWCMA